MSMDDAWEPKSRKQQLLERSLNLDLEPYVRDQREAGLSWKAIARKLTRQTGVPISFESLRSWYPDGRYASDRAVS